MKKSCTKSEKLLKGLKVAPNLKSCSKVAEQLMYSPISLLVCLPREIIKCPLYKSRKVRAFRMRSFASKGNFHRARFFVREVDLLYRTENSKTSPKFLDLIAKIRYATSPEFVNLIIIIGIFLATCYKWYFLRPKYAMKNVIYATIWRHVCMYVLYLQ